MYYTKKVINGKTKYIPKNIDNVVTVNDLVLALHKERYDKSLLLSFYKLTNTQISNYFVYYNNNSPKYQFYYMKTGLTATTENGQVIKITKPEELVEALKKGYTINQP